MTLSLPINALIFAFAAFIVWRAGARLAGYADEIAKRTGLGQAVIGVLLLAGVTSLPEIATSFTAAINNSPQLAANNLLGSIAMQIAVLAIADQVYHKRALTSVVPDSTVMVQGALNLCLLSLVAVALASGDRPLLGAGYWSWGLIVASVWSFIQISKGGDRKAWIANISDDVWEKTQAKSPELILPDSNTRLAVKTTLAAILILVAGATVATTAESLAEQSGLGASFMGMAFVAIATSLPEMSTVFAAIKRHLYTMAISDILGTNILNIALLGGVDLISQEGPILNQLGRFSLVAASMSALMTGLLLFGLAERRDKTIGRMGVDSALILLTYSGGLVLLYQLRDIS